MRAALLIVACAALAACEGGGDPVQQALRDASAERQAAAYQGYDQTSTKVAPPVTSDAEEAALDVLIAETRRAAEASERLRDSTTDPALREIAETQLAEHQASITALESRRSAAPAVSASAD
ncbi:indole-3-glycerol-phosphate synthase [Brevundimonas sp.]|uniref:indole-3-glycerol-phosphate synthase n=1 Tax=Brevundimonas sp. TaxID=1871086 RepID=UPI0035AECDA1